MQSNDTNNRQSNNRQGGIKSMGRGSRINNKEVGHREGRNGKTFKNDKIGRGESKQDRESSLINAIDCKALEYYTPVSRSFNNCTLGDIQNYYIHVIQEVFGFRAIYFIEKKNLKKEIEEINFEKENILQIISFLKDFQNEI